MIRTSQRLLPLSHSALDSTFGCNFCAFPATSFVPLSARSCHIDTKDGRSILIVHSAFPFQNRVRISEKGCLSNLVNFFFENLNWKRFPLSSISDPFPPIQTLNSSLYKILFIILERGAIEIRKNKREIFLFKSIRNINKFFLK